MGKPVERKKVNKRDLHAVHVKKEKVAEEGILKKYLFLWLLAGVVLITFIIYSPALHNQFTNWDDGVYVTDNPFITSLSGKNISYMFSNQIANNYHPLTMISLALNYNVSGLTPFSYYLVNIIFHLFNILLVYWLVVLLSAKNKPMALFVAALFAVHPMHVESVAWIAERKDVLYTFFFLSGLISYLTWLQKKNILYYVLCLALFLLSALSKPTAVIFPVVLLLADYLKQRKFNLLVIAEKIPFFAISLWIGWQTMHSQIEMVSQDMENFTIIQKILFASYGFYMYIARLFVPTGLSAFYAFPPTDHAHALPLIFWITPLVNIALVAGVIYSLKYTRLIAFGLLFYFLAVSLTLQFVQVGHSIISDRYTYLAYIGLLMALFWLTDKFLTDKSILSVKISYILMFLFFTVSTVLAAQRVKVWKNTETLWTDTIEKYPETALPYNSRGLNYFYQGQYPQALADYTKAIESDPRYFEAYYNRAGLYIKQGKNQLAINDLNKAVALNAGYSVSFRLRGDAYSFEGKIDSAMADYQKAIQINPDLPEPYRQMGNLHAQAGQFDTAIVDFNNALARRGNDPELWFSLGTVYGKMQKFTESINCLTKALEYKPDFYDALTNRALAYANTGNKEGMLNDMADAIRINPENPTAYFNRALFYLNNRKKDLACSDLQAAMKYGHPAAKGIYEKECMGR